MTLGSLFDGSGTCPLAATMCGMTPVWAREIETFPVAVTSSRFPNMKHLGDIKQINGAEIEPVDVISFGSPCQNFSLAGNREGLQGKDSSLFLEAIRVIKEMRTATNGKYPQLIMFENVIGLFSSCKGDDFKEVLTQFVQICDPNASISKPKKWGKAGLLVGDSYSIGWRTFNSVFWGVPQNRRRVFLVMDTRGQCAGEILFKRESLSRNHQTVRTRKTAAEIIGNSLAEYHDYHAVENHAQDNRVTLSRTNTIQTLNGRMGTGGGERATHN